MNRVALFQIGRASLCDTLGRIPVDLGTIRNELEGVIPAAGYAQETLDQYINEAYQDVAAKVTIPDLKGIGSIATTVSVGYVTMTVLTGGFSGTLKRVRSSVYDEIAIYPRLELLFDDYTDMSEVGDVEAVCLEGSILWYVKIPAAAQTLTVLYYSKPPTLSSDGDIPSLIPDHLHRKLLVHGAAWKMWDDTESGVDGEKVNTNNQLSLYNSGIADFGVYLGKNRRHYVSSMWTW
jgi:hypothetical protein